MKLKKRVPKLYCAVCLFTEMHKEAQEAITVIGGIASCYDHLGYVQDEKLSRIILIIREKNAEV